MKKWYESRTFWVNAITLVIGVIGYVAGHDIIAKYPDIVAVFIAAHGTLNVVLRFLTNKSLAV